MQKSSVPGWNLNFVGSFEKRYYNKIHKFIDSCDYCYFQQTLEWKKVIEGMKADDGVFIILKNKNNILGFLPVFIFRSKYGNIINSIPYPGPLGGVVIKEGNKRKEEKIFSALLKGLNQLASKENCVAATIISSPFSPNDNLYRKHFKPDYELENFTLYINLKEPRKTNSHFRNNLKRMLAKAQGNKYEVLQTNSEQDLLEWHRVHRLRHTQIGLEPLPLKLLRFALTHLVKNRKGNFFVVKDLRGKIIAGCLVTYHKKIIDAYIYSGTKSSYRDGAMYLLINYIINWSKSKGFEIFNWQSSKPRGGGPYNFKVQWGSEEAPYYFFTKIYQPVDKLKKLGLDGIKEKYKYHFVLPYSAFR